MKNKRKKVLIVLIAGIGDFVLASKAIRAIRNGYVDSEIHLLTITDVAVLAEVYTIFKKIHIFPIRELRENKAYLIDIIRSIFSIRKYKFDMVVNLYRVTSISGAIKMGFLFLLIRCKKRIGANQKGFGIFLNQKAPPEIFAERNMAESMLMIAQISGGIPDKRGLDIFWNKNAMDKWRFLVDSKKKTGRLFVGINPGGDRKNRRWPSENFAILSDNLIKMFDAEIIILGGPGEETIAGSIQDRMYFQCRSLAGKVKLDELPYIISILDLFVTNDSGPMHIAAATCTPTVAIFGPENPVLFAPYTSAKYFRIVNLETLHPGSFMAESSETVDRLKHIYPDDVFNKCVELLSATFRTGK